MKFMKGSLLSTIFLLLTLVVLNNSYALTLSASASGELIPGTATYPNTVTNGDFMITGNHIATLVGNGIDEYTTWVFDFTSDTDYGAFSATDTLTSAWLTLTLTPKTGLITTDSMRINGLPVITDIIQSLAVGVTTTIEFELLTYYTSDQIMGEFASSVLGEIGMFYQDDAILSFASLDLTTAPVPEPATMLLFGLGILGLAGVSRKNI